MDFTTLIFVFSLMLPGFLLVGSVRRYLLELTQGRYKRKKAVSRNIVRPQLTAPRALSVVNLPVRKQADPWEDLTTALISEAFEKFSNER